jgi:hypothetical protein
MSTAPSTPPAREPRDEKPEPKPGTRPNDALVFDDPLSRPSSDDTDLGWGERPGSSGDSAADLARFLDEKPPHHL